MTFLVPSNPRDIRHEPERERTETNPHSLGLRAIVLAAAACVIGQAAAAHALLDHASPAVGSVVSASPPSVVLTYSEPVEPVFSTIQVTDPNGRRLDQGAPMSQEDGHTLVVKLMTLPPGVYTVAWHVTSVDTHKTDGHFNFTVVP